MDIDKAVIELEEVLQNELETNENLINLSRDKKEGSENDLKKNKKIQYNGKGERIRNNKDEFGMKKKSTKKKENKATGFWNTLSSI